MDFTAFIFDIVIHGLEIEKTRPQAYKKPICGLITDDDVKARIIAIR
jgi:hypothetical protein